MHYLSYTAGGYRFDGYVPSAWTELNARQLTAIASALYDHKGLDLVRRLLAALLGLPEAAARLLPGSWCEENFPRVQFLLNDPDFTTNPLPAVKPVRWRRPLWGPAGGLANVELLEFAFADSLFLAAARASGQGAALDQFVAVLYRPQRARWRPGTVDYAGDRRQDFNNHLIGAHAAHVTRLPLATKRAILLWYRGCRRALEVRYPHVFDGTTKSNIPPALAWDRVRRSLAGGKFGALPQTDRTLITTVLAEMDDAFVAKAEDS